MRSLPFVVPASVMAIVSMVRPTDAPISWDEAATVEIAGRTLPQLLETARHVDGVIAPYYLLMWLWTGLFGDSELALRAPSIIAMSIAAGVVGLIGQRLFDPLAGATAGVIMAVVPQISFYAQEARPYALAFCFTALATLLLYRALDEPRWYRWAAYGLMLTAAAYMHLLTLLVLAPHLVAAARVRQSRRDQTLVRFLVAGSIAAVLALPLALVGNRQHATQLSWLRTDRFLESVSLAPQGIFGSTGLAMLIIGLAVAGLRRWRHVELVVFAAAPAVLLIAASRWLLETPIWVPRYALYSLIPLVLLAGSTLTSALRWRGVPITATAAVGLLTVLALPQHDLLRQSHEMSPDSRALARIIADDARPGDGLVFARLAWTLRPSVYYYLDRDLGHDAPTRPRDLLLQQSAADLGALAGQECRDPAPCIAGSDRIWLVRPDEAQRFPTPVMAALDSTHQVVGTWDVQETTLLLYVRRTDASH